MNVALTSYLLSLAVFIPASGWVADRYGTRTPCAPRRDRGVHHRLGFVWACRYAVVFGGIAHPARHRRCDDGAVVGRLVLRCRTAAAEQELVAAMAWLTVPALLGPVMGPPLGGFIVTYFSWRWIFDINVPIGILGSRAGEPVRRGDVREPPRGRFDGFGLVLCGVALCGLMFGLETAGRGVVPRSTTLAMIGVGLVAVVGYLLHARRHPAPLLDLSLMRLPCFGVALSAMMLFRTGIGAIPFLLPLMFQVGFGDSAVQSGMITFASSAGALVMKPATPAGAAAVRLPRHAGVERRAVGGDDRFVRGVPADVAGGGDLWRAADRRVLSVVAVHRVHTLAYGDVPRSQMSSATSLYITCQQLAATIGISAGAVSMEISMVATGHTVPQPIEFCHAVVVVATGTLVAGPRALFLRRDAGTT